MFASLPMYDRPENRSAHDALWALIRDGLRHRGVPAPDALDHDTHHMTGWARPDLVLGQICNLPYRAQFRGRVTLIGAADHGLPDTAPGMYYSVLVVRANDPAESLGGADDYRFAYNEPLSNSGWGMPQEWAVAQGTRLNASLQTGAHRESIQAVIDGHADLAAVDCITFRNLLRWDPIAAQVKVIGRTQSSPGLTFITAKGQDPAPYFAAITDAIAALTAAEADVLGLRGIVALSSDAYDLPLPPAPVHGSGAVVA